MSACRCRVTTQNPISKIGSWEVRAKGPNVTPGYWRQPELTAAAFDDEGFYKFGDALKPADPDDWHAGFDFDGRISEDFKLGSGTWVSARVCCARVWSRPARPAGARRGDCRHQPRRIVGAGHSRSRWLPCYCNPGAAIKRSCGSGVRFAHRPEAFAERLNKFATEATGFEHASPARFCSIRRYRFDRGEVTDKGSINQRAVLEHRYLHRLTRCMRRHSTRKRYFAQIVDRIRRKPCS